MLLLCQIYEIANDQAALMRVRAISNLAAHYALRLTGIDKRIVNKNS